MQTLILKSYDEKILAVAEYLISSSGINIKFSVRGLNFPGIHKLLLMSSLKPGNEPVIADTLELKDGTCFLERTVTSGDVAYKGYYPGDIDTFVLAGRDGNRYFSEAVGFLRFFLECGLVAQKAFRWCCAIIRFRSIPPFATFGRVQWYNGRNRRVLFCGIALP